MTEKVKGSVLVVGGGISGMQSALDLANSGYYVYLLEKSPSIGGAMAQLDKTFPTNDCAMWIISPKLVEVGRHLNIELITYADLESVEGSAGNFKVKIKKRARSVDMDRCTGCGSCVENCPVTHQRVLSGGAWKSKGRTTNGEPETNHKRENILRPAALMEFFQKMNETKTTENGAAPAIDYLALDKMVEDRFDNDKENLIMILQAIQAQYNYLPRPVLAYLSEKIEIPLSRIYGVATFYSTFSLEPRGENIISICLGTACHVRGAGKVLERIEDTLNVTNGKTTDDGRFTLESVRCIGCCSLGPVVKINEDVYGRIASEDLTQILDNYGESQ